MNWVRQLFQRQYGHKELRSTGITSHDSLHGNEPLRFTIYKATGGLIIQTFSYTDKQDTENTHLYLIYDNENLASELSKIITLETLKL
jgi:hypothetical protein